MNRTIVATVIALSALTAAGITGCVRPNKDTTEKITAAQSKLNTVKSGVEWQTGQQQLLAGDLDKALSSVNKSLKANPNVAKSHVLKGRIILEKGDSAAAEESFAEAERLDPESFDAQYYQGIIAEKSRNYEGALARYKRAMELDPANPQYVVAAAEMLVQMDRRNEAKQLLLSRSADISNNAGIRQCLGQIEMLSGDAAKAAEYFSEARLLAPDDVMITEQLARAQVAAGQYAEADYSLTQLFKNEKLAARRDLQSLRARCLMELDRLVDARSLLLKLIEGDAGSRDTQAWVNLGEVCARLNDTARLKTVSQRLIALAPDRWEGYAIRGMWFQRTNRQSDALTSYQEAVKRADNDVTPLILCGTLLSDMGRNAEARQLAQRAAAQDPANPLAMKLQSLVEGRAVAGSPSTTD